MILLADIQITHKQQRLTARETYTRVDLQIRNPYLTYKLLLTLETHFDLPAVLLASKELDIFSYIP